MTSMKFTLPAGVFPETLEFTPAQEEQIVQYSDELVAETLHVMEDFITSGRRLDPDRWKFLRSRERMHVYRSRKVSKSLPDRPHLLDLAEVDTHDVRPGVDSHKSGSSSSSSTGPSTDYLTEDSLLDAVRPANIPMVVVTGIMDGDLFDLAFGGLADNLTRWRLRNSYLGDEYDDMKLLARIHTPSEEDPFRFLGVKWTTRLFGPFMKQRDFLYLEASGIAFDSNGDRVSYLLLHSYPIEQVPELTDRGIIRGNTSTCIISRQHSKTSVEVFARAFADPGGDMFESIGVTLFTDAVLAQFNVTECALVKKLMLLMTRAKDARLRSGHAAHGTVGSGSRCASCDKSLSKLGVVHTGSSCQVCRRMFCTKCTVHKKVSVDMGKSITQKSLPFCVECVMEAKNFSSWDAGIASLPVSAVSISSSGSHTSA